MSTKTETSPFILGSSEAAKRLDIPTQKLYGMRDISIRAANPRKPVLQRNKDWNFVDGKVMFTMESIEKVKQWRKELGERKAISTVKREPKVHLELMVVINGIAETITGKPALRIQKIVDKLKQKTVAPQ